MELDDPALGQIRVGGYIQADPEAFIDLMEASLALEARQAGPRHVVISRPTLRLSALTIRPGAGLSEAAQARYTRHIALQRPPGGS